MATEPVPIPVQDPIARPRRTNLPQGQKDPNEGKISDTWVKYFTYQTDATTLAPQRLSTVELTAQSASISATAIPVGALSAGLYRVSYYARVTTAASTSSSLTVSMSFTDGGITVSFAGAAMTGNTTSTAQTGTHLIQVDSSSPITYTTTYASVGATSMQYKLYVILEAVNA